MVEKSHIPSCPYMRCGMRVPAQSQIRHSIEKDGKKIRNPAVSCRNNTLTTPYCCRTAPKLARNRHQSPDTGGRFMRFVRGRVEGVVRVEPNPPSFQACPCLSRESGRGLGGGHSYLNPITSPSSQARKPRRPCPPAGAGLGAIPDSAPMPESTAPFSARLSHPGQLSAALAATRVRGHQE